MISILAWWGLLVFTFFLIRIYPGGPFDDEIHLAPQVLDSLNYQYGLNQNLASQLLLYLKNFFSLNFGLSILYPGKTIAEVLIQAYPRSLTIGFATLCLSVFFGCSLGVIYFLSKSKNMIRMIHYLFLSTPSLFLGPSLILIFGIWLNWLPIMLSSSWTSYILPVAVMSVRPTANMARLIMSGLEESLSQPWVITAKAFGLTSSRIVMKYGIKQSLIPALSYLGQTTAGILSGSILIEMMFNVQGLGSLFIESVINRDYGLITTLTVLYGSLLIFSGLIFDLISFSLDPRMEKV
jgi:oligopeptide transport system permease protein